MPKTLHQRFLFLRRHGKLASFGAVCLFSLFFLGLTGANDKTDSLSDVDFGVIQLQPSSFRLEMERQGIVEPAESEEVRSQCFWKTQILSIVPEGTWVQEGDVVCVLDSAEIEEYARSREGTLIRYRGLLDNALHEEKMQSTESERTLSAAEFQFGEAEENHRVYTQASFPDSVSQLEDDLRLQSSRLSSLQDDAGHVERLWLMGISTSSEMSRTSLSLMTAEQDQAKLQNRLDLLTGFTHPRASLKLDYSRTNAARNIVRTQLKNSLSATKARLSRLAWERRVSIYEKYHKRAIDSIEACTLRAPRSGQVIYGNSWWERSRGITRIEEGKTVRLQQKVFEIPAPRQMKVSVPVDEALVYKVQQGMDLTIVPLGYPDVEVAGKIRSVARYPRSRSRYTPGIKDYWVDVELAPTDDQFKYLSPKTDVSVHFVLDDRKEQLVIPRDAVTGVSGHNFVFVLENDELVSRKVELGTRNDQQVCIKAGLVEGDKLVTSMTEQHQKRLFDALTDDLGIAAL